MWTALFGKPVEQDGRIAFTIIYTDGVQKIVVPHVVIRLDDEALKAVARADIVELDQQADDKTHLTIQPGQEIDTTPPDPPDPPDPRLVQFREDFRMLLAAKRMVDAGVIQVDDSTYTDRLATAIAGWDVSFLGLV